MDENQKAVDAAENPAPKTESEIIVNDYGAATDAATVIEEATRTVLLTEDETIIIEKQPAVDLVPKNRPRRIYAGMWGPLEIATVGVAMLAILTTILLFVLLVLPAQKQLEADKFERDRLETELVSAKKKYGDITNIETHVATLTGSVDDFENRFLPRTALGQTALYQRINGLIAAYNLVNTTGPDYAPLEIANQQNRNKTEAERGREKFQSLFPGVYVTTTLEGSYQNLRRFIREIETSDQFIVISAIALEPSDNEEKNQQNQTQQASINHVIINPNDQFGAVQNPTVTQEVQPSGNTIKSPRGKTHGETVSLRLELAAYFRRSAIAPTTVNAQQ